MALQDIHAPSVFTSISSALRGFFVSILEARGMRLAAEARRRHIAFLNTLSDEELAEMRLRRSDIAAYVFRDLMYS